MSEHVFAKVCTQCYFSSDEAARSVFRQLLPDGHNCIGVAEFVTALDQIAAERSNLLHRRVPIAVTSQNTPSDNVRSPDARSPVSGIDAIHGRPSSSHRRRDVGQGSSLSRSASAGVVAQAVPRQAFIGQGHEGAVSRLRRSQTLPLSNISNHSDYPGDQSPLRRRGTLVGQSDSSQTSRNQEFFRQSHLQRSHTTGSLGNLTSSQTSNNRHESGDHSPIQSPIRRSHTSSTLGQSDTFERSRPDVQSRKARGNVIKECGICWTEQPLGCLVPCGHMVCSKCISAEGAVDQCPFCRQSFDKYIELFLP